MSAADQLLAALDSADRSVKLNAIFQLGQAFAGAKPEDADCARVVAKLEAMIAEKEYGAAWVRKRAKRALAKIKGTGVPEFRDS